VIDAVGIIGFDIRREAIAAWHLGFVDELALGSADIHMIDRHAHEWFDRSVLHAVRNLRLTGRKVRCLQRLADTAVLLGVQALDAGIIGGPMDTSMPRAIARALPRLSRLALRSANVPPLAGLAPLPLEVLELDVIGGDVAMLAPLLCGTILPDVRELTLCGFHTLEVVDALIASGRIRTIDRLRLDLHRVPLSREALDLRPELDGVAILPTWRRSGRRGHILRFAS
jgi:hypothetical protein